MCYLIAIIYWIYWIYWRIQYVSKLNGTGIQLRSDIFTNILQRKNKILKLISFSMCKIIQAKAFSHVTHDVKFNLSLIHQLYHRRRYNWNALTCIKREKILMRKCYVCSDASIQSITIGRQWKMATKKNRISIIVSVDLLNNRFEDVIFFEWKTESLCSDNCVILIEECRFCVVFHFKLLILVFDEIPFMKLTLIENTDLWFFLSFHFAIFRERLVHMLALRPYKKPEIYSKISNGKWIVFFFFFLNFICFDLLTDYID